MNYGIKEIDEFKAPSRKPWMVLLVFVLLGLVCWVSVSAWRGRERKPKPEKVITPVADASAVTSTTLPPKKQAKKRPPVNLKAQVAPKPSASVKETLTRAKALISKGDRVGARQLLLAGLKSKPGAQERTAIESELAAINVQLAFLPYNMPEKVDHVVKRGDSLDKMSKKYGVTVQSIQIGNDLKNPNLIKAGDHLRILDADFSIEVGKERHELLLLMNGSFFKRYKVGLGKFDKTPLGTFEIYDRIVEPVWWRPDGKEIPFGAKENILGTRWMAIRATGDTPAVRGYGIHGTWNEASIGKSESAGCVRMRNAEVEELFNLVPLGTTVTIHK
jgi:lipoprotein-anchoring transpeptidase ErfK/SrfK